MINKLLYSVYSAFSEPDWTGYKLFIESKDAVSSRKYFPLVNVISKYEGNIPALKDAEAGTLFNEAYKKNTPRRHF